jgi:hypothetical protein
MANLFPEGGNMARCRVGGVVVAAFALTVTAVRADLVPEGQARSVKSTVESVEQMQSSGDDSPFNASVASVFSAPYVLPNTQVSTANQSSLLGASSITGSGDASATSERHHYIMDPTLDYSYHATADSSFQYTFSVAAPIQVSLTGMIHATTTESFAFYDAVAMISLSSLNGPALATVSAPMLGQPVTSPYDARITFTGTLSPGDYVLAARASAAPAFVGISNGIESEHQEGSFQFTLEQVPEPACALLGFAFLLPRRRRTTPLYHA